LRGQLRPRRHLQLSILTNRMHQDAFIGFAGYDRRSTAASFEQAVAVLERDAAIFELVIVAAQAAFLQNRRDAVVEELRGRRALQRK